MDSYQQYIHKSRYARYVPALKRRETWSETVIRYCDYFKERGQLTGKDYDEVFNAILNLEVMPSMSEMMYILMCGTGVGFSVERQYVSKLPEVSEDFYETETTINVVDSKIGWAKAYRELVSLLYSGQLPSWDVSKVRPAGATLKTFGGRASGAEPLVDLFKFTVEVFKKAAGRKLSSIECHDICCKIAQIVVVGGVRRSALISLSNLTDDRLRRAKHGQWWVDAPHRGLANNSACYTEKPDFEAFLNEWVSLYESRSGERGIFSRVASQKQAAKNGRRDSEWDFGTNPCSEIILRPNQFCNLSEVVVRSDDTLDTLRRKVRVASILGTLQATLTDFRYLRKMWKQNTEEEALLGVSMTGILDHKILSGYDAVNEAGKYGLDILEFFGIDPLGDFNTPECGRCTKSIGVSISRRSRCTTATANTSLSATGCTTTSMTCLVLASCHTPNTRMSKRHTRRLRKSSTTNLSKQYQPK
jgi:ribonucleoside-triphosphate reductase (thioredoxin)